MGKLKRKSKKGGPERWTPSRRKFGGLTIAFLVGAAAGYWALDEWVKDGDSNETEDRSDIISLGKEFSLSLDIGEGQPVEINGTNNYRPLVQLRKSVLEDILVLSEEAVATAFGDENVQFTKFQLDFPGELDPELAVDLANATNSPNYVYPDNPEVTPFTAEIRFQSFRQLMTNGLLQLKYGAVSPEVADHFESAYGKYGITAEVLNFYSVEDLTAAFMTMAVAQEVAEGLYSQELMNRGQLNLSTTDRINGLDAETDQFSLELSNQVFFAVLNGQVKPLFVFPEGNIDQSYFVEDPSYMKAIEIERDKAKLD